MDFFLLVVMGCVAFYLAMLVVLCLGASSESTRSKKKGVKGVSFDSKAQSEESESEQEHESKTEDTEVGEEKLMSNVVGEIVGADSTIRKRTVTTARDDLAMEQMLHDSE